MACQDVIRDKRKNTNQFVAQLFDERRVPQAVEVKKKEDLTDVEF